MDPVQPISSETQPFSSPPKDSRMTMRFGAGPKQYIIYALLGLLGVIIVGFLWNWVNSPMLVTVSGTGEVSAPVDSAIVSFVITSSGATPTEAMASVKAKAENMTTLLSNQGIADEDIAESEMNVIPASTLVQGATGYQVSLSMGVKTVHVSNIDGLINLLYSNGAAVVSQPIVSVEDTKSLEQEALNEAMDNAKEKAGKIGNDNLKFIRKIVAITQSTPVGSSTATSRPDAETSINQPESQAAGVIRISKTVSVTYKMW